MLIINNKMFLNRQLIAAEVDANTKHRVALAHILTYTHSNVLNMKDSDFDNVLLITDRYISDDGYVRLDYADFQDTGFNISKMQFPKTVKTVHMGEFNTKIDAHQAYKDQYDVIVIGFVNTIPESVFDNIYDTFRSKVLVLFGDPILDSSENGHWFMRYLTNKSLSIKSEYDSNRISDKKKINNFLFKIRKDTENLFENSTSLNVGINRKDDIDIYSMVQKIDEGDTVIVVPKRISGIVKSRIYEYRNETDDLTLDFDTILYLRRPWTFEVNNQRMIAPPLTKIKIANVKGVWQADDGTQLLGVDILIYSDDKDFSMVKDVLIDYTDFILQFSYTEHPNNQELFHIAIHVVRVSDIMDDMDIMKVTPDLVFTCEDCKYFEIGRTIAYIESVEKEVYFETDSHYYNYFCNTLDNIEIIWSEEFDL